jgi:transposase InsO family protein
VIDLATRMVVGWQLAAHMRTRLVVDALQMAVDAGHVRPDAVFHSDRGTQGGFNRSKQHLDHGGAYGAIAGMDYDCDGEAGDALAWASSAAA